MPSLSAQLGLDYVDQFYRGAYFLYNGEVFMYGRHRSETTIRCHQVDPVSLQWKAVDIPSEVIETMDFFAWPKLGYREYDTGRGLRSTAFLTLQRSAMRGLKRDLLNIDHVGDTYLLPSVSNMRDCVSDSAIARVIFKPTFTKFDDGIHALQQGTVLSFALSEDLAVSFSCTQGPDRMADVLYKQKVIGEVKPNGEVVIPHKIAKKASSSILFNGKLKV